MWTRARTTFGSVHSGCGCPGCLPSRFHHRAQHGSSWKPTSSLWTMLPIFAGTHMNDDTLPIMKSRCYTGTSVTIRLQSQQSNEPSFGASWLPFSSKWLWLWLEFIMWSFRNRQKTNMYSTYMITCEEKVAKIDVILRWTLLKRTCFASLNRTPPVEAAEAAAPSASLLALRPEVRFMGKRTLVGPSPGSCS